MDDLQTEKTRLEIAELRQKVSLEPFRAWATPASVLIGALGLAITVWSQERGRDADQDQLRAELTADEIRVEIAQMNSIAQEVGGLCARTNAALLFGLLARVRLDTAFERLETAVEAAGFAEGAEVLLGLELVREELAAGEDLDANFINAIDIQLDWSRRQISPSPEYVVWYGEQDLAAWRVVSEMAWQQVNDRFAFFGPAGEPDMEALDRRCTEFCGVDARPH